jgi:hypothetical protein
MLGNEYILFAIHRKKRFQGLEKIEPELRVCSPADPASYRFPQHIHPQV